MSGHVFTGIRKGFSNGSYYTSNFLNYLFVPRIWYQHRLEKTMSAFSSEQIKVLGKIFVQTLSMFLIINVQLLKSQILVR